MSKRGKNSARDSHRVSMGACLLRGDFVCARQVARDLSVRESIQWAHGTTPVRILCGFPRPLLTVPSPS